MLTEEDCSSHLRAAEQNSPKREMHAKERINKMHFGIMEWGCVIAAAARNHISIKESTDFRVEPEFQKPCDSKAE